MAGVNCARGGRVQRAVDLGGAASLLLGKAIPTFFFFLRRRIGVSSSFFFPSSFQVGVHRPLFKLGNFLKMSGLCRKSPKSMENPESWKSRSFKKLPSLRKLGCVSSYLLTGSSLRVLSRFHAKINYKCRLGS